MLTADLGRVAVLRAVGELGLPECMVAAGFVRNAVWDRLHDYDEPTALNDIDVVFFDDADLEGARAGEAQAQLGSQFPDQRFSVKNQALMHLRNHHDPYRSTADGISRWPETCTAVGVMLTPSFEVLAPHGLGDLFALTVRPTDGSPVTRELVRRRIADKGWTRRWPRLRVLLD